MALTDTYGNPIEATVVRLRNDGDKLFSQKYGGVRYQIPAGGEAIVPYMAMCLWLGHPDAVDMDKKRRFRTQEFQRLCVKWGIYEHHDLVDERFPKVSAWSIIDNTEYITVVKDPDGKHLTPDVQTKAERDRMQTQLVAMQAQIAMLQAQMEQNAKEQAAEIAAGDTRTDQPSQRPELTIPIPDDEDSTDDGIQGDDAMVDRPGPKPVMRS